MARSFSGENTLRIAILWDWQLGALTAQSAQKMGHDTMIFWVDAINSPAAQVSEQTAIAYNDIKTTVESILSWNPDVVTIEWENIPVDIIKAIEEKWITIYPNSRVLEIIQHRKTEKEAIVQAWASVAEYVWEINSEDDLINAFTNLWPGILKTAKGGYDSKWQISINSLEDIAKIISNLKDGERLWEIDRIYEKREDFEYELSVIIARRQGGEMCTFEPAHNVHKDWILETSTIPANKSNITIDDKTIKEAKRIAEEITEKMWVVWLLTVEMFVMKDGTIKVNELAPRPHNSGHGTIESYTMSQYDTLVEAITDEDFWELRLIQSTILTNLLGNDIKKIPDRNKNGEFKIIQSDDGNNLYYDYGKWINNPNGDYPSGRKMGHTIELI